MTAAKKSEKIDFRVSKELKERIQLASSFVNEEVAQFIISLIEPEVNRILDAQKAIKLNDEAWDSFLSMLTSRQKASVSLRKAMREYKKIQES